MNHHYPDNFGYGRGAPAIPGINYSGGGGYADPSAMARMNQPRENYQMSHYPVMQQQAGVYGQTGYIAQQSNPYTSMGGYGNYGMQGVGQSSMMMGSRQGDMSRMGTNNNMMSSYYNADHHGSPQLGAINTQAPNYNHAQSSPHMVQSSSHIAQSSPHMAQSSPHMAQSNPHMAHHHINMMASQSSSQTTMVTQNSGTSPMPSKALHAQNAQATSSSNHLMSQVPCHQNTGTYANPNSPHMLPCSHHVPQHPMRHPTTQQNPQEVADNILQMASAYPSNQTVQVPLKNRPAPYHIPRSPHYSSQHSDMTHTSPNPQQQQSPVSTQTSPSPSSSSVKSPAPVLAPIPNPIPSPGISGLRSPCNQGMSPCGTQRSPIHMGSTYSGHSQSCPPSQCSNETSPYHLGMSPSDVQHYSPCAMTQSHNYSSYNASPSSQRNTPMYSPSSDHSLMPNTEHILQSSFNCSNSSNLCTNNASAFNNAIKHSGGGYSTSAPLPSHLSNNPLMSLQKLVMLPETQVVDPKSVVNDACLSSHDEGPKNGDGPAERLAESSSHSVGFQGKISSLNPSGIHSSNGNISCYKMDNDVEVRNQSTILSNPFMDNVQLGLSEKLSSNSLNTPGTTSHYTGRSVKHDFISEQGTKHDHSLKSSSPLQMTEVSETISFHSQYSQRDDGNVTQLFQSQISESKNVKQLLVSQTFENSNNKKLNQSPQTSRSNYGNQYSQSQTSQSTCGNQLSQTSEKTCGNQLSRSQTSENTNGNQLSQPQTSESVCGNQLSQSQTSKSTCGNQLSQPQTSKSTNIKQISHTQTFETESTNVKQSFQAQTSQNDSENVDQPLAQPTQNENANINQSFQTQNTQDEIAKDIESSSQSHSANVDQSLAESPQNENANINQSFQTQNIQDEIARDIESSSQSQSASVDQPLAQPTQNENANINQLFQTQNTQDEIAEVKEYSQENVLIKADLKINGHNFSPNPVITLITEEPQKIHINEIEKGIKTPDQSIISPEKKNGKIMEDVKRILVQCRSPGVLSEVPIITNGFNGTSCEKESEFVQDCDVSVKRNHDLNTLVKTKLVCTKRTSHFNRVTPCSIAVGADERAACERFTYRRNGVCRVVRTSRVMLNGRSRGDSTGNADSDESSENVSEGNFLISDSPQDGSKKRPSATRKCDTKKPDLSSVSTANKVNEGGSKSAETLTSGSNGCMTYSNNEASDEDVYYEGVDSSDIFVNNCSSDESVAPVSDSKNSTSSSISKADESQPPSSGVQVEEKKEESEDEDKPNTPNFDEKKNPSLDSPPSKRLRRSSGQKAHEKLKAFSVSKRISNSSLSDSPVTPERKVEVNLKSLKIKKEQNECTQSEDTSMNTELFKSSSLKSNTRYPVVVLEKSNVLVSSSPVIKKEHLDQIDLTVDNDLVVTIDSDSSQATRSYKNTENIKVEIENKPSSNTKRTAISKKRTKKRIKKLKEKAVVKGNKNDELKDSFKSMKFSRTLDLMKSRRKRESSSMGPFIRVTSKPNAPPEKVTVFYQPVADTALLANANNRSKKNNLTHSTTTVHMVTNLPLNKVAMVPSNRTISQNPWECAFCGHHSSYRFLGDLFGPYFKESELARVESIALEESKKNETSKDRRTADLTGSGRKSKEETPSEKMVSRRRKSALLTKPPEQDLISPEEIWVHEACAMWSPGVCLIGNKMYGLDEAVKDAADAICSVCKSKGAMIGCLNKGCSMKYHFICAIDKDCYLDEENVSILCPKHKDKKLNLVGTSRS